MDDVQDPPHENTFQPTEGPLSKSELMIKFDPPLVAATVTLSTAQY